MNHNEMLLLKLGEVVLKGLNRRSFEDKLVSNVRRRLKSLGSFQVYVRQSTIYVEPQKEECDMAAALAAARQQVHAQPRRRAQAQPQHGAAPRPF